MKKATYNKKEMRKSRFVKCEKNFSNKCDKWSEAMFDCLEVLSFKGEKASNRLNQIQLNVTKYVKSNSTNMMTSIYSNVQKQKYKKKQNIPEVYRVF